MSVARMNELHAKEGCGAELREFLRKLEPMIRSSEGCEKCEILECDTDDNHYVLLEFWDSIESHERAANKITTEERERIMDLLLMPPTGDYFHRISERPNASRQTPQVHS